MLEMKLVHVLLAELLERGQRDTGIVKKIVLFYNGIWNCSKYSKGLPVLPRQKLHKITTTDNRVERIYAAQRC